MISTFKSRLRPKPLCAGATLWLLLTSSPAFAVVDLVKNGAFAGDPTNGQLNFNSTVPDWTTPGWPGSYFFLWNPAPGPSHTSADTTGAPGILGNVTLWGPSNGSNNGLTLPPDGGAFVGAIPAFHNGPLQQTITGLTPGLKTIVSFDWAGAQQHGFNGATEEDWSVSLGSQSQDTGPVHIDSHGFSGWMHASLDFTPTSSTEVLKFLATGTANEALPPFALLSNVSVQPIPEPSTWVMMALGFGGLAYAGFRSNRRKPAWTD